MGGFGEGLGRVWGGFWEGFWRVWEPFGRSRVFSALFLDFARLCWGFAGLSWPFLVPARPRRAIASPAWLAIHIFLWRSFGSRVFSALFLDFARLCWGFAGLSWPFLVPARPRRAIASPAWLAIHIFLWRSFGLSRFSFCCLVFPQFPWLFFSACFLVLSLWGGCPDALTHLAASCFPLFFSVSLALAGGKISKKDRASRSLLRQVFFEGLGGVFLRVIF